MIKILAAFSWSIIFCSLVHKANRYAIRANLGTRKNHKTIEHEKSLLNYLKTSNNLVTKPIS